MANAIYNTSNKEGVDINAVFILDTGTPEYPRPHFTPGEICHGTDGSSWLYCWGAATLGAGSVVLISEVPDSFSVALAGGATVATAPTGRFVGVVGGSKGTMVVPAPTGTQTGCYFWVQRLGIVPNIKTASSTTANTALYSSATVGGAVSVSAGGSGTTYSVSGIVITQATGSAAGPNTGVINWPVVGATG